MEVIKFTRVENGGYECGASTNQSGEYYHREDVETTIRLLQEQVALEIGRREEMAARYRGYVRTPLLKYDGTVRCVVLLPEESVGYLADTQEHLQIVIKDLEAAKAELERLRAAVLSLIDSADKAWAELDHNTAEELAAKLMDDIGKLKAALQSGGKE